MDEADGIAIHQQLARKRRIESDSILGGADVGVVPRNSSKSYQRLRCNICQGIHTATNEFLH